MGKKKDKPGPKPDGKSQDVSVAVIGGICTVLAAVIAGAFGLFGKCEDHKPAPEISIQVFRLNEPGAGSSESPIPQSLASGLPIDPATDLKVQIWVTVSKSERPKLIWIDTKGQVQEFSLMQHEEIGEKKRFIWPGLMDFRKVEGPPGTEVILACSKAEAAPSLRDLSFDTPMEPWPEVPRGALLRFDNSEVKLDDDRGPAKSPPSDSNYLDRVRELQSRLTGRGINIAGIAFLRAASQSKP